MIKLAYLELCGFRGYRKSLRLDFADGFTIIEGRNGVGKSTVFDAVEFALTGTIGKYGSATADGETVADYFWWNGGGAALPDHYVEVGFHDGARSFNVRRTRTGVNEGQLAAVTNALCDDSAPAAPLGQLCTASILRDELIATLSLDLKEADRFTFVSEALGATDADTWKARGLAVLDHSKRKSVTADAMVKDATGGIATATRRVDELRSSMRDEEVVSAAWIRLQGFTGSSAPIDQISELTRAALARSTRRLEQVGALRAAWSEIAATRSTIPALQATTVAATSRVEAAQGELLRIQAIPSSNESPASALAQTARDIAALVELGRRLGTREDHCPLCAATRTADEFARGLSLAERHARELDLQSVQQAERERARAGWENEFRTAEVARAQAQAGIEAANKRLADFEARLATSDLAKNATLDWLVAQEASIRVQIAKVVEDLSIVETLKVTGELEKGIAALAEAKLMHARAEQQLGVMKRAESRAQALYDAVRRASSETVDLRLERVFPLMSELYRRLRPHPFWAEIDYKVRGDVRRFLSLQVGDDLNPQFMYSSGQRRATGLAFLLAVNLSLAWSRWHSVLLDDPVQHIDDFRSVHLAEVLAQVASSGRQVICAAEDSALADLLCRRLPVDGATGGKRVTLGIDDEGDLAKVREDELQPLLVGALVSIQQDRAG